MMKACHCYDPEERRLHCFPLIASLSAFEFCFNDADGKVLMLI